MKKAKKTKQKTRKSLAKRFRITKTGKVLRRKAFKGHLNTKKSAKRKRRLGRTVQVKGKYAKKIIKRSGVKVLKKKTEQKGENAKS